MSRIRLSFSYANVMATIAVFIALGGTALASVIVSKNSQVATGTISGHHPPKGDHPNIIGGSLSGTDLSKNLKGSLRLHCPSNMRLAEGLCFEDSLRPAANLENAVSICALAERRLPSIAELAIVFNNSGAPQKEQRVASQYFDDNASFSGTMEENSSRQLNFKAAGGNAVPYRCVASPTN